MYSTAAACMHACLVVLHAFIYFKLIILCVINST